MRRLNSINWLCSSSLLLVSLAGVAGAQGNAGRSVDTVHAVSISDSTSGGRNWFVSLLRKIARRSDDAAPGGVTAEGSESDDANDVHATEMATTARAFKSRRDSLAWAGAKTVAEKSAGYRVVVDVFGKQLRVIDGEDTLRVAPVATAKNETLEFGGKTYRFVTPRGVRTVIKKDKDPVWTPPDWHFAEVALEHGLKVRQLKRGQVITLSTGTKLKTVGDEVGVVRPGSTEFEPMVLDEHIVFDNTLFIPPAGTKHRVIQGELGHFRLDMGEGYLLHGTPYAKSIGAAVTHGCIRLRDDDIEWLYENVPVGTKVFIY